MRSLLFSPYDAGVIEKLTIKLPGIRVPGRANDSTLSLAAIALVCVCARARAFISEKERRKKINNRGLRGRCRSARYMAPEMEN